MLKNVSLCRSLLYGLLLFWLALGWLIWPQFPIYFSAPILILGGWFLGRLGPKPLTGPLLVFWTFGLFVSVLSGGAGSMGRIYFWAVLIALYHLPHNLNDLQRGACWTSWPIFVLSGAGVMWASVNVIAMFIWGLFWLGWPMTKTGKWRYLYTGLACWSMLNTQSEGGLLAMLAGFAIWSWLRLGRSRYSTSFGTGLGLIIGLVVAWILTINMKLGIDDSTWKRLEFYRYAWSGFIRAPVIGNGLNTYTVHISDGIVNDPHNLILTVLWEMGLVGLLISLWLVFRLIRSHEIDPWAAAWLVTFFSHSMVSIPFNSLFTAATLFIILGGLPCREKITWAWLWPRRWGWPWPAQLSRSRPQ